jgi:hypothetical protein
VEYIRCLPFQVFVTGVDRAALPGLEGAGVFHVEQGEVRPVV